jgi:hypothetical protein
MLDVGGGGAVEVRFHFFFFYFVGESEKYQMKRTCIIFLLRECLVP